MKKSAIFTTLFLFLLVSVASAQISFGPKVGISQSKVQVDERFTVDGNTYNYSTEDAAVGFHIGAFTRLQLGSVFVQPELLFTSSGGKVLVESDNLVNDIRTLRYNKIDLPVMGGFKFAKFLRVQVGPVFSLLLTDDARNADVANQVETNYNNAVIGYQAGVGLDLGKKLYIDLKYEGNLSKLGESVEVGDNNFATDLRNTQLMLSVGWNLF